MGIPTSLNKMGISKRDDPFIDADYFYIEAINDGAVALLKTGSPPSINLKYSINKMPWKDYTIDEEVSLKAGDKIYFAGNNKTFSSDSNNLYRFVSDDNVNVGGNIMSLLDKKCEQSSLSKNYVFAYLLGRKTSNTKSIKIKDVSNLKLSAVSLSQCCYFGLFTMCDTLSAAPELPATTLADDCYAYMFSQCTSLRSAPELPVTTLSGGCYRGMFIHCYALSSAPELPATTLAQSCYNSMFDGCSSLSAAPALPATALATGCYGTMFRSCYALSAAPELPATTLANGCYMWMFQNCYSLSRVKVNFTDWGLNNNYFTSDWLVGVAANGTFECPEELPDVRGVSNIPQNWNISKTKQAFYIEAREADTNASIVKVGSPDNITLSSSYDMKNWYPYTMDDNILLSNVGDRVYFKGNNSKFSTGSSDYYKIKTNKSYNVGGHLISLLDETIEQTELSSGYCFVKMFYKLGSGVGSVVDASNLKLPPTVSDRCYENMFSMCNGLSAAPELPASMLAEGCYASMFYYCTALSSAPVLSSTTLTNYAYSSMFNGCSNLSNVEVKFTSWTNATNSWLGGVAANGTFTCPSNLDTTTRDSSHVPADWTVVTT